MPRSAKKTPPVSRHLIPGLLLITSLGFSTAAQAALECTDPNVQFDVNDVSFLWPVPKTATDANELLSGDMRLADGTTRFWPEQAFNKMIQHAQTVSIDRSQISFGGNKAEFEQASTWKVAGIRVDPSAPSIVPEVIEQLGESPQIRLIMQPVTLNGSKATVHDVTAHLVFTYASSSPTGPAVPDRKAFCSVVNDLKGIKLRLEKSGVKTSGELSIHPGFTADKAKLTAELKTFLSNHLKAKNLSAMAFMGLDTPEPWIFFAMQRSPDGTIAAPPIPTLPGNIGPHKRGNKQMLNFRGGDIVSPAPQNSQFGLGKGVDTVALFKMRAGDSQLGKQLDKEVFPGDPSILQRDVADIIANPALSHFFNADCVSCHTESARRVDLGLSDSATHHFELPTGVSGIDPAMLPTSGGSRPSWNVRNFGWFPDFFAGGATTPTITMRTANEAADSVHFINEHYLAAPTLKCENSRTGSKIRYLSEGAEGIKFDVDWDEGATFAAENHLDITNGTCKKCPRLSRKGGPLPHKATFLITRDDASKAVILKWGPSPGMLRACGADRSLEIPPVENR